MIEVQHLRFVLRSKIHAHESMRGQAMYAITTGGMFLCWYRS